MALDNERQERAVKFEVTNVKTYMELYLYLLLKPRKII
jgi:hypothetical protein